MILVMGFSIGLEEIKHHTKKIEIETRADRADGGTKEQRIKRYSEYQVLHYGDSVRMFHKRKVTSTRLCLSSKPSSAGSNIFFKARTAYDAIAFHFLNYIPLHRMLIFKYGYDKSCIIHVQGRYTLRILVFEV